MSLPEKEKILIHNAIVKQINEIDISLSQVGETETVDLDQSRMGRLSRVDAYSAKRWHFSKEKI